MDKNALDKFGPNMPKLLEHVGTHILQVVLCSWFFYVPYTTTFQINCYTASTNKLLLLAEKEQGKRW